MAIHHIEPDLANLHGYFSRDIPPVLRVASGDTVRFKTLEAGWFEFDQVEPFTLPPRVPFEGEMGGHCLCGPVYVEGARAGDSLEIRIKKVRTGKWGRSGAGGFPGFVNDALNVAEGEQCRWYWQIDPDTGFAVNQHGLTLKTRPFTGLCGMPPAEPGKHSTVPPRFCGGNLDCKELIEGSTLFLPIAVDGGLLSLGDGHAIQGDGEVGTLAIEAPLELVEVELIVRSDLHLKMPRALTPVGWLTLGLHEDLNQAMLIALDGMLDLLGELKGFSRKEALAFASLCVDMRISQVVNDVKGVHAVYNPE